MKSKQTHSLRALKSRTYLVQPKQRKTARNLELKLFIEKVKGNVEKEDKSHTWKR